MTIDAAAKKLKMELRQINNQTVLAYTVESSSRGLSSFRDPGADILEKHSYFLELTLTPFRLKYFMDNTLLAVANNEQLLNFEEFRTREEHSRLANASRVPDATRYENSPDRLWFDTFGGKNQSVQNGPTSVGLDFAFPECKHLYGLPEQTTNFRLASTISSPEPYRIFHTDVYGYETKSRMALYGSIPYILAIGEKDLAVEMVWVNGADTWIDVLEEEKRTAQWFSESGTIEFFIFGGSSVERTAQKMALVSGFAPMPLYSAIGYHQSRYSFNDEKDVYEVDSGYDRSTIPYESIWLDIDHTNSRRYFTWNKEKFPNPMALQSLYDDKSRFVVTIVDPHLAQDNGYQVYKGAVDEGRRLGGSIFVRDEKNKETFVGKCWPGNSAYLDFLNAKARDHWGRLFAFDAYQGSTKNLFIWNDMNEPSVFESAEMTIPKNCM